MRARFGIFLVAAAVAAAGVWPGGRALTWQADDGFKTFNNSIVPVPAQMTRAVTLSGQLRERKLPLYFALETPNLAELEARVSKGETVPAGEMREKYSRAGADFDRLRKWLVDNGFEIVDSGADRSGITARATVSKIEKALGVTMADVTYRGTSGPAAITAPKLPKDVGEHVVAINGLQPFVKAAKRTVPRDAYLRQRQAPSAPPVPRPAAATRPTYKVADILKAYDADGLGVSGAGQTIAILIDTKAADSDLAAFWQQSGLTVAPSQVKVIKVQATLPQREGEETLDTEWVSGIAPGADVRVYASGSLEFLYLDRAFDRIYADALTTPSLRHVSISLGLREDLVPPGEITIEHQMFVKLAALGVSVFVSSGDAGSNPDETGHGRSNVANVEYQASDPFSVAVGGTSLDYDRVQGAVRNETGWGDSGGGVSRAFPRPAWQSAYASLTSGRLVPDVSAVADPDPGAFVWFNGREWPVGGTSWSAPVWAGFSALIAEARVKQQKPPIGFIAPVLYRASMAPGFRDIVSGSNGSYQAGSGWDPVVGIGVPSLRKLIAALP